jgi:hypothetical protein
VAQQREIGMYLYLARSGVRDTEDGFGTPSL